MEAKINFKANSVCLYSIRIPPRSLLKARLENTSNTNNHCNRLKFTKIYTFAYYCICRKWNIKLLYWNIWIWMTCWRDTSSSSLDLSPPDASMLVTKRWWERSVSVVLLFGMNLQERTSIKTPRTIPGINKVLFWTSEKSDMEYIQRKDA